MPPECSCSQCTQSNNSHACLCLFLAPLQHWPVQSGCLTSLILFLSFFLFFSAVRDVTHLAARVFYTQQQSLAMQSCPGRAQPTRMKGGKTFCERLGSQRRTKPGWSSCLAWLVWKGLICQIQLIFMRQADCYKVTQKTLKKFKKNYSKNWIQVNSGVYLLPDNDLTL